MILKDYIAKIRAALGAYYPKPEIDAFVRIIFERILNYSQVDMILHEGDELPDFIGDKIDGIIKRLSAYEPIQYILDDAYFYGLHFQVNSHTLIPRPETEQLIDLIAEQNTAEDLHILDIGTGSGCIAIALARTLKFPVIDAIDISKGALSTATLNAKTLKAKVNFKLEDILTATPPRLATYDIIVSNPPYIAEHERAAMHSNVLDYEPHSALFVPDDNPLLFYRTIAKYSLNALKSGGKLYFEINPLFADDMVNMLSSLGYYAVTVERDYTGKLRFTSAIR